MVTGRSGRVWARRAAVSRAARTSASGRPAEGDCINSLRSFRGGKGAVQPGRRLARAARPRAGVESPGTHPGDRGCQALLEVLVSRAEVEAAGVLLDRLEQQVPEQQLPRRAASQLPVEAGDAPVIAASI